MTFKADLDAYRRFGAALHAQADGKLLTRVTGALRLNVDPKAALREGAATLPRSGGLRVRVQSYPVTERRRPDGAELRLIGVGRYDGGWFRHPVFGHADRQVRQSVPAARGAFTKAIERQAVKAARAAEKAGRESLEEVTRKV